MSPPTLSQPTNAAMIRRESGNTGSIVSMRQPNRNQQQQHGTQKVLSPSDLGGNGDTDEVAEDAELQHRTDAVVADASRVRGCFRIWLVFSVLLVLSAAIVGVVIYFLAHGVFQSLEQRGAATVQFLTDSMTTQACLLREEIKNNLFEFQLFHVKWSKVNNNSDAANGTTWKWPRAVDGLSLPTLNVVNETESMLELLCLRLYSSVLFYAMYNSSGHLISQLYCTGNIAHAAGDNSISTSSILTQTTADPIAIPQPVPFRVSRSTSVFVELDEISVRFSPVEGLTDEQLTQLGSDPVNYVRVRMAVTKEYTATYIAGSLRPQFSISSLEGSTIGMIAPTTATSGGDDYQVIFHSLTSDFPSYNVRQPTGLGLSLLSDFHSICNDGQTYTAQLSVRDVEFNQRGVLQFINASSLVMQRIPNPKVLYSSVVMAPREVVLCAWVCFSSNDSSCFTAASQNLLQSSSSFFFVVRSAISDDASSRYYVVFIALGAASVGLSIVIIFFLYTAISAPIYYMNKRIVASISEKPWRVSRWERVGLSLTKMFWIAELKATIRIFTIMATFFNLNRKYVPHHVLDAQWAELADQLKRKSFRHHQQHGSFGSSSLGADGMLRRTESARRRVAGGGGMPSVVDAAGDGIDVDDDDDEMMGMDEGSPRDFASPVNELTMRQSSDRTLMTASGTASGANSIQAKGPSPNRHTAESGAGAKSELLQPLQGKLSMNDVTAFTVAGPQDSSQAHILASSRMSGVPEVEESDTPPLGHLHHQQQQQQQPSPDFIGVSTTFSSAGGNDLLGDRPSLRRVTQQQSGRQLNNEVKKLAAASQQNMLMVERATLLSVFVSGVEEAYGFDFYVAERQHRKIIGAISSIIRKWKGECYVRNGDRIAASWNTFTARPDHTVRGVRCAMEIAKVFDELRKEGFRMGIVVHEGPVLCGIMGDHREVGSVLFGRAADEVSKFAVLAAQLPFSTLISEPVKQIVSIFFECLIVDVLRRDDDSGLTFSLFEVRVQRPSLQSTPLLAKSSSFLGVGGAASPGQKQSTFAVRYNTAFSYFRSHMFVEALHSLDKLGCVESPRSTIKSAKLSKNASGRSAFENADPSDVASTTLMFDSDAAVFRLRRLCWHYMHHPEALPKPYARKYPQWSIYENDAMMDETGMGSSTTGEMEAFADELSKRISEKTASNVHGQQVLGGNGVAPTTASSSNFPSAATSQQTGMAPTSGGGMSSLLAQFSEEFDEPRKASAATQAPPPSTSAAPLATPRSTKTPSSTKFGGRKERVNARPVLSHEWIPVHNVVSTAVEDMPNFRRDLESWYTAANDKAPQPTSPQQQAPQQQTPTTMSVTHVSAQLVNFSTPQSPQNDLVTFTAAAEEDGKSDDDRTNENGAGEKGSPKPVVSSAWGSQTVGGENKTQLSSPASPAAVEQPRVSPTTVMPIPLNHLRPPLPPAAKLPLPEAGGAGPSHPPPLAVDARGATSMRSPLIAKDEFSPSDVYSPTDLPAAASVRSGGAYGDDADDDNGDDAGDALEGSAANTGGFEGAARVVAQDSFIEESLTSISATVHQQQQANTDAMSIGGAMHGSGLLTASRQHAAREKMIRGDLPIEIHCSDMCVYRRSAKLLGAGSYGKVYLGMDVHTGRLIALKFLPLPDRQSDIEKVLNEVATMQRVSDPNLVEFYGYAFSSQMIVLVMECLVAGSLSSMLQSFNKISEGTLVNYIRDVLRALVKLHSMGIVHRDVKPQNVLIATNGHCKLSDFGASASIGLLAREADGGLEVQGTPVYLSPEAARGFPELKSDVWSVGIMYLQLLTGKLPFPSVMVQDTTTNIAAFIYGIGSGRLKPVWPADLHPLATQFVRACLQDDVNARLSAAQLLELPFFTV